jgi:hypothetical protein
MSLLSGLGIPSPRRSRPDPDRTEHVMIQRPLQRVLAFRGRSIDDVVNDRIVKNEIYGYWKLYKQVERTCEVVDLERQWNRKRASEH